MNNKDVTDVLSFQDDRISKLENKNDIELLDELIDKALKNKDAVSFDDYIFQITEEKDDSIDQLTFDKIVSEARKAGYCNTSVDKMLSDENITNIKNTIKALNKEFNNIHKLDTLDYSICLLASLLSSAIDILLIGIPHSTPDGLKAGKLSDYIRK